MLEVIIFIIYIAVFLYSVILHEIAHGFVALKFGDDTARLSGRLSLNPLVHIDPFGSVLLPLLLYFSTGFAFGYAKPVPVNPYRLSGGSAAYRWVSVAGILTNLALALISAAVLRITDLIGVGGSTAGVFFFQIAFILNIVLAVFNAMPFPGFDGFNFLSTFGFFERIFRSTPLANPLFMARYGLLVSLLIIFLAWPIVQTVIVFIINLISAVFGI
ncbi:MAG: hypothetical protein A2840_02660 [Candidatus Buchananbacteria bacterium RIFCSPHIGHO2_01_FULL_47_11b]|uniref:Peptidase M50 domain-containing protein n=1 Tax=Candidatus Buchananbacteria bacterium RIFCSPHIGHO2_01_FULL_47_11b TaxID=1797537 RepID=A0A1G1Y423_9BACT|nr:MAG: hypothetical protein A2840_02660 [Candidatus Buchananbacteria bacterium RIFCSPHIGHO2_01_FULL_47_11b]